MTRPPITSALAFGLATLATFGSLAAPAGANSDLGFDEFETRVAEAKSRMMADPAQALNLAREARSMVKGETQSAFHNALTARWLEGEALMRLNRGNEASGLIDCALTKAAASFAEERIYADLLRSAGSAKARAGDFREALVHFQHASERYHALGDARSQAIVLQNIGSLFAGAGDYEKVLEHYRKAAQTFSDNGPLSLSANNNIGNALRGLGRYSEAEEAFARALVIARTMDSQLLEARITTNLASAQLLSGAVDKAEASAKNALALTSGSASGSASGWQPFVHGVLAQIALERGNVAEAKRHIALTFADQELTKTSILFRDFHEAAARIHAQSGDAARAELHQTALQRINDQAMALRL